MDVTLYKAKAQLSRLLDRVAEGEEIIITRYGRPAAKLVPAGPPRRLRKLGRLRGRIRVRGDFDAPLPPEILDELEGKVRRSARER
jgi:prevent-host-death family protein